MSDLHLPAGSTADGPFDTVVDPGARQGWVHTGIRVLALERGGEETWETDGVEVMVVPLSGACTVVVEGAATDGAGAEGAGSAGAAVEGTGEYELRGRADVFAGPTDVLYAPVGSRLRIASADGGRFALATAVASAAHPVALIRAEDVPVEARGGGTMSRQVRNFGTVGSFDACDSLIACEVITPGGNWSSYPAHKHDEQVEDPEHPESELEEIYYYEIAPSPTGTPGFGFHQTTSSGEGKEIDILAEVRAGDVVLVPFGWHGPCAAAPGHDMYYLNVMAGPGPERAWDITDHPDQTWVRGTW
ncbi:MAG: 5-deoxy-glucuronate isomerase [Brachybacterium faecium]|nr:MAG: 5-deoxy-glucuronate isomerase [Brachybacterium faecium]